MSRKAFGLDIGCGVGQFLYYLDSIGIGNLDGIDYDAEMAGHASKMVPRARIEHADAWRFLESRTNRYDFVVMNDVIEHLPHGDVVPVLTSIRHALKPCGFLLVKTPNMANPLSQNARYKDFTHLGGFTETSLQQVFHQAGFRRVEYHEEEGPVTSWRARIRKLLFLGGFKNLLRLCYYSAEISPVPTILTQWIICRVWADSPEPGALPAG
jgi:SAM-dependent methyltransferase